VPPTANLASIHDLEDDVTTGCVFCRIVAGESPAEIEYNDEEVLAFKDLYPKAPIHLLIIPKRHIESIARLEPEDEAVVGRCVRVARLLAERLGYGERGYRVSSNTGPEGGQVVYHLHFHLTAGRRR
jgi:histidine triad (HIT) family protein